MYFLRFAQPWVLYFILPFVLLIWVIRAYVHKQIRYRYSLSSTLAKHKLTSSHPVKKIFFLMRAFVVLMLALLIAKPQIVDSRSQIQAEGIDILLVMDISGSMEQPDLSGKGSRLDVAKAEAIRFVKKRKNDAIGLVVFAHGALSRCPLTMDKNVLIEIIQGLKVGDLNHRGTFLNTAIVTAANRLKYSQAKSKIMILLTDGIAENERLDTEVAIDIVKKLGIKVYTIGIGGDQTGVVHHPIFGLIPIVDVEFLKKVAKETHGESFMACNADDMRTIYDTIDSLEKNEHEVPIFTRYWDIYTPVVLMLLCLMLFECWLSTFAWFCL